MAIMIRLGIDLGTTRTVVAIADRGNYPIVSFTGPEGDALDHYPTVSAEVGGKLVHGLAAVAETARRVCALYGLAIGSMSAGDGAITIGCGLERPPIR